LKQNVFVTDVLYYLSINSCKMKYITLVGLLVFLSGCQSKNYYSSDKVFVKKVYRKNHGVMIEFDTPGESVYSVSGVKFSLNKNNNGAEVTFIRVHKDDMQMKVDVPVVKHMIDTPYYMSVYLPYKLSYIIITPPDKIYYVSE
jgi:hypothetical protein